MSAAPPADPGAVKLAYVEHHTWLVGMIRRQLGTGAQADAWDVVHDTFERLLRQSCLAQGALSRSYLATIARRLLIDRRRRQMLEAAYLKALAAQPDAAAPSAETLAQLAQQLLAVCAALERMPARMRRVFLLARLDGHAYADVARSLGVSVNVVQKDMVQAWQRLYHALHDC